MERSFTPSSALPDGLPTMDQTILNTPKPQASSTVNRRPHESLPPVLSKLAAESQVPSPSYLSNAIDEMRLLTDQLGSLSEFPKDLMDPPNPGGQQLRKAASVADLYEDRRESMMTESEANSSLGILKLDNVRGLSECGSTSNLTELLANFRKDYTSQSFAGKENMPSDPPPSQINLSRLSLNDVGSNYKSRQAVSDISFKVLNTDSNVSPRNSLSVQADLKLRLQKALAQRTIDRSVDSIRLSQMSEFDVDSESVSGNVEPVSLDKSKDSIGNYFSNSDQTPSPATNATFGAGNFMSFSGSPANFDSSENFQSADMAMDRLKQDENSWRQHFEDLPVLPNTEKDMQTDASAVEHLTQNLDLSTMSGIIAGEITVSSSIMEDVGKRRLSAGEYFKLHTEQLGGEENRPNFGNLIKSPPKRRPHPPLINLNNSQAASVDEVPTRDSGLNRTLGSSFADTFNYSASMHSDISSQPAAGTLASRSIDLMPPPPPRIRQINAGTRPSESRDSLSTRLSMSLSLPKDINESGGKDLNSSSLSLDSGEKFVSISQMVRIMQDLPTGPLSARQLVDDFMQKCKVSHESKGSESNNSLGFVPGINRSSHRASLKSDVENVTLLNSSDNSPSRNQRVKEWVSNINNSGSESHYRADAQDVGNLESKSTTEAKASLFRKASSSSGQKKSRQECNVYMGRQHEMNVTKNKGDDSMSMASEYDEKDDESVASFMPPPSQGGIPTLSQLRNFSTPKAHSVKPGHENAKPIGQVPNKIHSSIRRAVGQEASSDIRECSIGTRRSSQSSDYQSVKLQRSHDKSSDSKHSSKSSVQTLKSAGKRSGSQSDSDSKTLSDWKYHTSEEHRPPSNCGSAHSAISCTKSSSKQTDIASVTAGPLHIDSTHTQLSWASVSPGSSITHTFALRNRSSARVRLLVHSPNAAFKLVGERGELLSELMLTLHSEETRRIHVVFSPIATGPVVGKLVISRVATSESSVSSSEERRLIALYGYGGVAELSVEGASKDRWAQLFLNMCNMVDNDVHSEASDIDASNDGPHVIASFSVRNSGQIPAFISLQIAGELPFADCGVYVTPKEISLLPGEIGRVVVRFDPNRDILQWLNKNAEDMQLLANIWLSWSELATWQRIRRIYMKYYKNEKTGPLSNWGSLYCGDLGVGHELKDNKSSEAALAQAVRRLKVAVLIERERLNLFDMDATLVFDQLVANETAMFNSPHLNEITLDSEYLDSPILAGMPNNIYPMGNGDSPLSSVSTGSKKCSSKQVEMNLRNDLVVITNVSYDEPQAFSIEFPPTTLKHKSKVKITFQNPSSERSLVSISNLSSQFSVSTPKFHVQSGSYVSVSVLFRPIESGTHHSTLNVKVDGNHVRSYLLRGEGVHG